MRFDEFCRVHGLIVDGIEAGRWVRVPTTDHPRTKNGAYKWLGDVGFVQNHATMVDVSVWRPHGEAAPVDMAAMHAKVAEHERKMREGWERAAHRAEEMRRSAKQQPHGYLQIKGFEDMAGLVLPDESLMVPMRHLTTNKLVGAQVIRWLPDERKYEKKMLPGMRAKGAVFRLGSAQAPRTWLVEGYATGLSVEAAIRMLRLRDAVLICFSAGNLVHVAGQLAGEALVFADHDESGAGERAAQATGLRYCMAGEVGFDANDLHKKEGIFRVASLMLDATVSEAQGVP
jgi:putative DNA primase/helicase